MLKRNADFLNNGLHLFKPALTTDITVQAVGVSLEQRLLLGANRRPGARSVVERGEPDVLQVVDEPGGIEGLRIEPSAPFAHPLDALVVLWM